MKPIKSREFKRILSETGCVAERITGSHETWKLPNGRKITIVAGSDEVSPGVIREIRKLFMVSGYGNPFDQKAQQKRREGSQGEKAEGPVPEGA